MSCPYCKNKVKNEYIVAPSNETDGIDMKIIRKDGIALLAVSGWYDGFIGIETRFAPISWCPMCGERLVVE